LTHAADGVAHTPSCRHLAERMVQHHIAEPAALGADVLRRCVEARTTHFTRSLSEAFVRISPAEREQIEQVALLFQRQVFWMLAVPSALKVSRIARA